MMRRFIVASVAIFSLAGCQSAAPPLANSFSPSQAAFSKGAGSGGIVGQAFARQRGGGIVTAAGNEVYLVPDQAYTRAVALRRVAGQFNLGEGAPMDGYFRRTVADASGTFRYSGLPAGSYIAMTRVEWEAPGPYAPIPQGGWVASPVAVRNGTTTEVVLTR